MNIEKLKAARKHALELSPGNPPERTSNQFFGVGPITDMTRDEFDARKRRIAFDAWLEASYPKLDDQGRVVGNFTQSEFNRGMHRGYPADKVLLDMMGAIHRYFEFPDKNHIAVGLGGGHSGFTVAAMHLMSSHRTEQNIFVDTPRPESEVAGKSGFFRQSWGAQLIEMMRYAKDGDEQRLHFAEQEGGIPSTQDLCDMGIQLFFGVGHETTGATTYTEAQIRRLLGWIDRDPDRHHAVIDATSMLGAMPWSDDVIAQVLDRCCLFTPFQKAIGGVSGYFILSMTPQARLMIDANMETPSWAIPRQLKIAVPEDARKLLSSRSSTRLGPLYDPVNNVMLGGIINTFSTLAFAETTFAILQNEKSIGDVKTLNQRSIANRQRVADWVEGHALFTLGVKNPDSRGAAVTLLKVCDADIEDSDLHLRIIEHSKKMLGYEGLTHPNGEYEKGLDVARYVNAFPGTDGDYRAWIGGIRPQADITALLDNIEYCYLRAKIQVLEQVLAEAGVHFEATTTDAAGSMRYDDPDRDYRVLIADLVGMRFDQNGEPDYSEVKAHIEGRGGRFHVGTLRENEELEPGCVHFFYAPALSTDQEILGHTQQGQYDALIAAATFIPEESRFSLGGVRIGAGTGNMGSGSWGGGNGDGGKASLMNTPSFNSRATAQMAIKALLKVMPDLPVEELHRRVAAGEFDTSKQLADFPTSKIEGRKIAVIGYGNIGREVARLARAFGMRVTVYARERHKQWIISEGFEYADSIQSAAQGADVISPHLGLGPLDAQSGKFANQGLLDAKVFSCMNPGAVLINYDRGELVDTEALDQALTSGQISYAAVDADIFIDGGTGSVSGPMAPYLDVHAKHPGKLELLPHAAADTEHISRVQGACQAVDQIYDVIHYRRVTNRVGSLPEGYSDAGTKTVDGVGAVSLKSVENLSADELKEIRSLTETLAAFWGALEATKDAERRRQLIDDHLQEATSCANEVLVLFADKGLQGPYYS